MNFLQHYRLSRGLTQPQVSRHLKEVEPRADVGMVSRYEKGVCLPTPAQMETLEAVLGKSRHELYAFEDINLVSATAQQPPEPEATAPAPVKSDNRSVTKFRKCYRLPREFVNTFPSDLLDICGYVSWDAWHAAAIKRLLSEYAARKRAVKDKEEKRHAERN